MILYGKEFILHNEYNETRFRSCSQENITTYLNDKNTPLNIKQFKKIYLTPT
jgi:hypothetical protein